MPGYPARISRSTLGPQRRDLHPARDESYFFSARYLEMLLWQAAGLNVVAGRAGGLIVSDLLSAHEEAWASNGGVAPTFLHVGTGHYRVTYAATYADETDEPVVPALSRAKGHAQSTSARSVSCTVTNGLQVDVYVFTAAGDPVDDDVWFEVW